MTASINPASAHIISSGIFKLKYDTQFLMNIIIAENTQQIKILMMLRLMQSAVALIFELIFFEKKPFSALVKIEINTNITHLSNLLMFFYIIYHHIFNTMFNSVIFK